MSLNIKNYIISIFLFFYLININASNSLFPNEYYSLSYDEKLLLLENIDPNETNFMFLCEYYNHVLEDKSRAITEYEIVIELYGDIQLPMFSGVPIYSFQAPFTVKDYAQIEIAICYQTIGNYQMAIEYYHNHYPWYLFYFEIAECYRLLYDYENMYAYYAEAIIYHLSDEWGSQSSIAEDIFNKLKIRKYSKRYIQIIEALNNYQNHNEIADYIFNIIKS